MTRPGERLALSLGFSLMLCAAGPGSTPAYALDLGYTCRADADRVFVLVSETVQDMTRWRSIRIVDRERTVRAVVQGRRNIAVPVWIRVRDAHPGSPDAQSELHVMWEQSMEPLNHPDLTPFTELFDERQRRLGLDCTGLGTDIGL